MVWETVQVKAPYKAWSSALFLALYLGIEHQIKESIYCAHAKVGEKEIRCPVWQAICQHFVESGKILARIR